MIKDFFVLSLKNLKHRGIRSWLTILGIFVGIAAVVALISLGSGLKDAVVGQFASLGVDKLIVQNAGVGFGPPGSTSIKKLTQYDLDLISKVNGIEQTISRLIRMVSLDYNKKKSFVYVGSLPEKKEDIDLVYETLNTEIESGKFLTESDRGKIILGYDLKKINDKEVRIGEELLIQNRYFEISGILKKSSTFQMNNVVIMPEKDLKEILNIGDEIDLIVAKVNDPEKINEIASDIERKLRKDRGLKIGEEDFSVQTPVESLNAVSTILNIVNVIVIGIAIISLIVGGIGIANTMYTSVLERKKEIGVMKAIGAKNSDILWIFLIESGLLGLVGGLLGAIFGLGFALLVSNIGKILLSEDLFKVTFSGTLFFGAVLFSFLIGAVSGVLPAMQASKLNVVDALRK